MRRWLCVCTVLLLGGMLTACGNRETLENTQESVTKTEIHVESSSSPSPAESKEDDVENEFPMELSDMLIRITSGEQSAVFQLYDTAAALELYHQLPLELETENFRDAQWMFYPPEKLNVAAGEAYHDGKKGELSYYEPWGDVFILYEDFYAGDEMHRLGICLEGIDNLAGMSGSILVEKEDSEVQEENTMKVTVGDTAFTATLADNSSAQALKELLAEGPLTINMRDYGSMEKVGPIGQSLPENNEQITTEAGDIILYLGNSLVIYYDTNSWNFTRIGKINDVTQEELKAALGSGNVTVTFELEED